MALTVIIVERVPTGVRGDLTRWMVQPRSGVFVGDLSSVVRDRLWDRIRLHSATGSCVLVSTARNEQGFEMRCSGDPTLDLIDIDGLALVRRPLRPSDRIEEASG